MLQRSPSGTALGSPPLSILSVCLSIGTDSPVRAASAQARLPTSIMRKSAGTRSPRVSMTTSPGTMRLAGTLLSLPSRTMMASLESMAFRASAAFSAEPSWMMPMVVLITMTPTMIPTWMELVTGSSVMARTAEMTATKTRMPTSTLLTCCQILMRRLSFSFSVSLFSPYLARRVAASSVVRPRRRMSSGRLSSLKHSSVVMACHDGWLAPGVSSMLSRDAMFRFYDNRKKPNE
mmetsp:Transcript_20653/g.58797  ORF Transcript_20653/g.58797 Transcript_20653/m.58797 type:complete len:234 (-) Transcript_20653:576-1277(-)